MMGRSTGQAVKRRTRVFRQQNLEAARIILSDPNRYGGLAVTWARLFIERENKAARASYSRLPLFCTEAA
jgi:hypothetical protein